MQGYQQRHQYIVTQGPLKDTVDDFWRMVWEHRASTIMMLCQLEEKGKVRNFQTSLRSFHNVSLV